MYFIKIGELLFLRCPGASAKTAGQEGLLSPKNIKHNKDGWGAGKAPYKSHNPILRGISPTSARTAPPLVVTMGTSGV